MARGRRPDPSTQPTCTCDAADAHAVQPTHLRHTLARCRLAAATRAISPALSRRPQGRGGTTGYDSAGALVALEADAAEGQSRLFKETNKVYQVSEGSIEFAVNRVDGETGEFSGVFVSEQVRPPRRAGVPVSVVH